MDRDNLALSIMLAFGLFLLAFAWMRSGGLNIPEDRASLGENPDQRLVPLSLGPIIFVMVVASIVWMMYGRSGFTRLAWIDTFARSVYRKVLRKAAADSDGQSEKANDNSSKDRELDEILWTISKLKKEALNSK